MSHSTLAKRTTLRAEDLADALMVSVEDIYAYCDIFDQDPDDEWALRVCGKTV